ncbi:penicillin-binding Tp47 domain C-containing protein [Blautia difficilis]|uniref:Ig-like domain-containing protein n=1 Tax=Blautia difficilis TaxID=2763027 RepID=A0ABR7IJN0_9FIRM|nr:penicillin-binding Tp47 domain C-containing protein [Blautia difficilis]MBC5780204.1 Ig-like domain-containing protein [Blautia difficilis]
MRKGNLIKMAAPAILSAAMMVSGLPVMAADFTADTVTEAQVQADDFAADEEIAGDDFSGEEETPFVDEQQAAEDEFAATAEEGYKYVYAGLTWEQYWASEGVYNASNTSSNATADGHGETDKGGFDTVTRATVNHGLHRGSYQCEAVMYDKNGGSYEISYWTSANDAVLTDGTTVKLNQPERGQITKADGSVVEFDHYTIVGLKYVPVAVKAADYEAFKSQFKVVEDGSTVAGGFGEKNLQSYSAVADVTAETNGLKEAVKGSDGTFTFKARANGTGSGLKDQALQTASNVTATVKEASGSYGEFLRVDITGDGYGALGAKMYAVRWDYYGKGDTVLASYGTKFAADNWMHKAMGIQLGLTDSYRCQLPKGTDGTGKWKLTVYAMGYADTTFEITATEANIVKPEAGVADTTALKAAVERASALKEADYTADSWKAMQLELDEAKELLAKENPTQAEVDEATTHLNAAVQALVKAEVKDTLTFAKPKVTLYKGQKKTQTATVTGKVQAPVYTSSNRKIATVDKKTGKVTAKAAGKVTITAKSGSLKATYTVTVKNPTLKLTKTSATVKVGKTTKITAKATPSGKITYKSSNKKIATVSSNGTVKGIKKGTAKITVTCNGVSKTFKVTVK